MIGADLAYAPITGSLTAQRHTAALQSVGQKRATPSFMSGVLRFRKLLGAGLGFAFVSGCSSEVPTVHTDHRIGVLRTVTSYRATVADKLQTRVEYFQVDCVTGAPVPDGVYRMGEIATLPQRLDPSIPGLGDIPLDHGSRHVFSDHFQVLTAGCFDVVATPIDEAGVPVSHCAEAKRSKVRVEAGKTVEIVLLNQCTGKSTGGLDTIVVRNHPPVIERVDFEDSKFGVCAETQVVCVSAKDPDGDPMRIEWEQISTSAPTLPQAKVVLQDTVTGAGEATECVEFVPPELGRYDLRVRVFDLAHKDGDLVEFDKLTQEGHESSTALDFFFYSLPGERGAGGTGNGSVDPSQAKSGILILAPTVAGGQDSDEAVEARKVLAGLQEVPEDPQGLGERVDVLSADQWKALTREELASYRAIVLGDPDCAGAVPKDLAELPPLWSTVVNGNVLLLGSNPSRHDEGKVIGEALRFATADPTRTGAYISTSCYFHSAASNTPLPWLQGFGESGAGTDAYGFRVVNAGGCPNKARVISRLVGAGEGLVDTDLSEWGCSAHNFFESQPRNFEPFAVVTDYVPEGTPVNEIKEIYVLARGAIPFGCGDGSLNAVTEECDDGNLVDGDGCDRSCNLELCGDGLLQGVEYCDDGNSVSGDGCSATCEIEPKPCQG